MATLTLVPPAVAALSFSPDSPIGGQSTTGTITLTAAAPADGATIPLTLSASSHGCGPAPTAPANVVVPGGSASGTFTVSTSPGMGEYFYYVSGKSARILLREPLITQNTLVFPSSVKGGTAVQAKLVFNGAAGPPATCPNSHQLSSSNTALAQVPTSVTTPQGASSVPFMMTTAAVPSTQTVTITVYGNVGYGYASYQKTLTLTP
ncbi:MAG TPA: hypothetical protein VER58_10950 [Thermoanaerobaculia bacterium]|nr:hypothetical protein [Thermoanaerobaculia bacterium]